MMLRKDFHELIKICRAYDPYTRYIDNYKQEMSAQAANERLDKCFNEAFRKYVPGYNEGVPVNRYHSLSTEDIKTELEQWLLKEFNILVEQNRVWEVSTIRNKVATDDAWAIRGLLIIDRLQHFHARTNVGFTGSDRKILSNIALYYLRKDALTDKQMEVVKKLLPKYADQLARIANEELFLQ